MSTCVCAVELNSQYHCAMENISGRVGNYHTAILSFVLFTITFSLVTSQHCATISGEKLYLHQILDESPMCCRAVLCPKGHYPVKCTSRYDRASCQVCPENTYMHSPNKSPDMRRCERRRYCDTERFVTVTDGNAEEDRVCGCDIDRGFYNSDAKPDEEAFASAMYCHRKICPRNHQLKPNGECVLCKADGSTAGKRYGPCTKAVEARHTTGRETGQTTEPIAMVSGQRSSNVTLGIDDEDVSPTSQLAEESQSPPLKIIIPFVILALFVVCLLILVICLVRPKIRCRMNKLEMKDDIEMRGDEIIPLREQDQQLQPRIDCSSVKRNVKTKLREFLQNFLRSPIEAGMIEFGDEDTFGFTYFQPKQGEGDEAVTRRFLEDLRKKDKTYLQHFLQLLLKTDQKDAYDILVKTS